MSAPAAGPPRESLTSRRLWLALGGYAAMLTALAMRHEMWRDEVRAFSVATRASSWMQMFADLHNEGHPALWYMVLRAGFAVSTSNLVLPIAAVAIAIATAYLILRHAPFPFWLRLLAVFGVFLGFELSVMARNYGIGVFFMIATCAAFPRRGDRPWLPAVCLALMANTSVHAALGALVIMFIWLGDAFDDGRRAQLRRPMALASIAFALAAVAISFMTARPTPDMAWAFTGRGFDAEHVLRTIFSDPGVGLRGVLGADVVASGEFPWRYFQVNPAVVSRVIVDVVLLWLLRSVIRRRVHFAAMVITVVGFELLFREVYSGALRHEAVIAFLLFAICWLAIDGNPNAVLRRRIIFGLLPLFAIQAAALPFVAQRYFFKPASASKAYGKFVASRPEYRDAILMSEPDYLMEAMPYYAPNRVYMPRQREFHYRVYFDRGEKRQKVLTLSQLLDIADKVSCENRAPVLLALGNTDILWRREAVKPVQYRGARFSWTADERKLLRQRTTLVTSFPQSISDEYYHVFLVDPMKSRRC